MATIEPLVHNPSIWWRRYQLLKGTLGGYVTEPHIPRTELCGKWIIISGGNNGIGREAALFFARKGANLILACREPPAWETHPNVAVEECLAAAKANEHSISQVEWWPLDMADLDSVEAFAQRWVDTGRALDILCNNAGIASPPSDEKYFKTKDGFEIIHQVNFLSHVLLTLRLLPSIAKAARPRIICTVSCMQYAGQFDLENVNFENESAAKGNPYANNKLFFQVWLTELQHRMNESPKYKHVIINGVHPGMVSTGIWNSNRPGKKAQQNGPSAFEIFLFRNVSLVAITPQQGSLAITHAATTVDAGKAGGRYFSRIWEAPSMPVCHDPPSRLQLWHKVGIELKLEQRGLSDVI